VRAQGASSGARWGSHGYTRPQVASVYPRGYTTTGYGYSGFGGYVPYIAGSMTTFWVVSSLSSSTGYGHWYANSNIHAESGGECNKPHQCSWKLRKDEELIRDDLTALKFQPSLFSYPLTLIITQVLGQDYNASRICPPSGWNASGVAASSKWLPPQRQDIFFALSEVAGVSQMAEVDDSSWLGFLFAVLMIGFLALLCRFQPWNDRSSTHKEHKVRSKYMDEAEDSPDIGRGAWAGKTNSGSVIGKLGCDDDEYDFTSAGPPSAHARRKGGCGSSSSSGEEEDRGSGHRNRDRRRPMY